MENYPKAVVKKGAWSIDEDRKLSNFINTHGLKGVNWDTISQMADLNRPGKSCRLRWKNYLSPNIRRGNFSEEEESIIIHLQSSLGNKWSQIAAQLPGRTDNDIKNYWNTKLRKKVFEKPVQQYYKLHDQPQTPIEVDNLNLINYNLFTTINTLSVLLGVLNMPQSELAEKLLLLEEWEIKKHEQEIAMAAIQNNHLIMTRNNGLIGNYAFNARDQTIPSDHFDTNLTSNACYQEFPNMFDSNAVGILCSNNNNNNNNDHFPENYYPMIPALVSPSDHGIIPMPIMTCTDQYLCPNPNSEISYF